MSNAPNDRVRRHAFVSGRVQGVGFRWHCQRAACARDLAGWVRNVSDGRVELEVEGAAALVEAFFGDVARGPSGARVADVTVNEVPLTGDDGFRIRFDA
jgi:acylphosphatase